MIQNAGFASEVRVMTSGKMALEYFDIHKSNLGEIPDLIFLDLNMPVVDGFVFLFEFDEFPEEVKEKCKIVVLSSISENSLIDKILSNEYVFDFVPKPITAAAIKRVEAMLEASKSYKDVKK